MAKLKKRNKAAVLTGGVVTAAELGDARSYLNLPPNPLKLEFG